jgi:hypothetical protein
MLKSDWFFRLLIKFLKKNLLYERVAELYLSPIKEGIVTCLSEAYSTNYLPEKMFFGTLSCTLTEALQDGLFDDYNFEEYEKKWSQFIWKNRNTIPEEIREELGFYYGGLKCWYLDEYLTRFGQDTFYCQIRDTEDED